MRNRITTFILLAVILCVALVVVDVYEGAGLDLDKHPVLQYVMMAAYSIIIASFLALIATILWRGLRGERPRK